jgi:hypothetical protein
MVCFSTMGTGLILEGKVVLMPGFDIENYLDNPALKLASGDVRFRNARERNSIHVIVMHTTGGIPGGTDLRPQTILPGFGASSNAGERIVGSWTHDTARPGGAHIIVDFDGRIYCCADLVTQAAYHAQAANGPSVGIEVVQGHGQAELYLDQIAVAAKFALALCAAMPTAIQRQIPTSYSGHPIPRFVASQQTGTPLSDVVGIVGHRDLTASRGSGDPGNAIMDALETAGAERMNFASYEDIITWKQRQAIIGLVGADGIPGPHTVAALKKAGRADGLWRSLS